MSTPLASRPNVVLFISHDTGRFLSPYGYQTLETPNFERLASIGTTFDSCFCTTPLCAPSRASITTGLYHHQNGMMGLPGPVLGNWDLKTKDRHLANVFRENGYRTVLSGFLHETNDLFSVGFEEGIHGSGNGNNGGMDLAGTAADIDTWLTSRSAGEAVAPFYLQIGCSDTHREWSRYSEPYNAKGIWKAPYLIDDPVVDREMAEQQGACRALDNGVGEILNVFETRGLSKNTIFVFTTDHGIDFPRAKGTLFDPGMEVFLFMLFPPWGAGRRIPNLISNIDIYPTVLEACGIAVPDGTSGRSFLQLLSGEHDYSPRDTVYLEKTYHDNYDPMRGLRTDRYKYILNFDAQTLYDVRIATAPRYNWFRFPFRKSEREELYDLEKDPVESRNVINEPEYQELRGRLKKHLADWMAATDDPILDGPIASPYHLQISSEMRELGGKR